MRASQYPQQPAVIPPCYEQPWLCCNPCKRSQGSGPFRDHPWLRVVTMLHQSACVHLPQPANLYQDKGIASRIDYLVNSHQYSIQRTLRFRVPSYGRNHKVCRGINDRDPTTIMHRCRKAVHGKDTWTFKDHNGMISLLIAFTPHSKAERTQWSTCNHERIPFDASSRIPSACSFSPPGLCSSARPVWS